MRSFGGFCNAVRKPPEGGGVECIAVRRGLPKSFNAGEFDEEECGGCNNGRIPRARMLLWHGWKRTNTAEHEEVSNYHQNEYAWAGQFGPPCPDPNPRIR